MGTATSALFPTVLGNGQTYNAASSLRTASAKSSAAMAKQIASIASKQSGSHSTQSSSSEPDITQRGIYQTEFSFNASWELDLWGKIRNQRTVSTDMLLNTALGYEASRLSVAGATAKAYFTLLSLDLQQSVAERTLKVREEGLRIYDLQFKAGEIDAMTLSNMRAEAETARIQIHNTQAAREQAEGALATLLGRSPAEILKGHVSRGRTIEDMPAPPVLPEGLPSEILLQRPDIQAAEFLIKARNANIGVARAEFFPSLSLTGVLGTASAAFGSLFTGPAATFSYGASASLPILDFGRNWYNLKDAEAQKQVAIANYRKTIQSTFEDVRTALSLQKESAAIVDSYQYQIANLRKAMDLAKLRYDNGYSDYLSLLDAQRQLFAAEMNYTSAMNTRLSAVVDMCMALGGGWQAKDFSVDFPIVKTEKLVQSVTQQPPSSQKPLEQVAF